MDLIIHWVAKSWTRLSNFHFTSLPFIIGVVRVKYLGNHLSVISALKDILGRGEWRKSVGPGQNFLFQTIPCDRMKVK